LRKVPVEEPSDLNQREGMEIELFEHLQLTKKNWNWEDSKKLPKMNRYLLHGWAVPK
jgi:hypothetical protein